MRSAKIERVLITGIRVFCCQGTWEYSVASKDFLLRFIPFKISNDRTPLTEEKIESHLLPTEIQTQKFLLVRKQFHQHFFNRLELW